MMKSYPGFAPLKEPPGECCSNGVGQVAEGNLAYCAWTSISSTGAAFQAFSGWPPRQCLGLLNLFTLLVSPSISTLNT